MPVQRQERHQPRRSEMPARLRKNRPENASVRLDARRNVCLEEDFYSSAAAADARTSHHPPARLLADGLQYSERGWSPRSAFVHHAHHEHLKLTTRVRVVVSKPENPESPRLKLADLWSEEGLGPLAEHPPQAPRKIVRSTVERPRCVVCEGDVMRSHVRFYERPWVMWSKRRPYRCMDCGVRQWRREESKK
jgi:hypothetical protein